MKFFLMVILIVFAADSTQAQVRKKRTGPQSSDFKTQHFVGPIAQFNNISGIEWEMTMKNKSGGSSKSTFSLIGGYASRYSKIMINDSATIRNRLIHGVGGAIVLNNYINSYKEGPYWSVGASGNYYFRKAFATQNYRAYYETVNLKTFSVFINAGYKYNITQKYALKPNLGFGIMGSPFQSSSSSEINGFFVNLGCSLIFKWK